MHKFLVPATVMAAVDSSDTAEAEALVRAALDAEVSLDVKHDGFRLTALTLDGDPRLDQIDGVPAEDPNAPWPAPPDERPVTVAAVAAAAAELLGDGWSTDLCSWGTYGSLTHAQYLTDFKLVEHSGGLRIEFERSLDTDTLPDRPNLPKNVRWDFYGEGVDLDLTSPSDGLHELAGRVADAIRAVTGRP